MVYFNHEYGIWKIILCNGTDQMSTVIPTDLKSYDFLNGIFSNVTLYSHYPVISAWFFFSCLPLFCLLCWLCFFVLFCCFCFFLSFFLLLQELVKEFQWWPSLWKEVPMLSLSFWSTCETLLLFLLWYVMEVVGHLTYLPLVTNTLKKEGKLFASSDSYVPWDIPCGQVQHIILKLQVKRLTESAYFHFFQSSVTVYYSPHVSFSPIQISV